MIRTKTVSKSKNFEDYETACIWGKYYTMLAKEKEDFEAEEVDVYDWGTVIHAKYSEGSHEYGTLVRAFGCWFERSVRDVGYEEMTARAEELLKIPVLVGGCGNKGKEKLPAAATILRYFAYLSSAITHFSKNYAHIPNAAIRIVNDLRPLVGNG